MGAYHAWPFRSDPAQPFVSAVGTLALFGVSLWIARRAPRRAPFRPPETVAEAG